MKKIVVAVSLVLALLLCPAVVSVAQQQTTTNNDQGTVLVKKSDLTPDQLAKIQQSETQAEIDANITRYGKWVGLGKEVGVAVNSSLGAITDQADHFAKTGVGKLTIALVIWKVVGDQAVHVLAAVFEVLIFFPLWIWSYRKFCFSHRILVKKADGFFGAKDWQVVEPFPDDADTREGVLIGHWVSLGVIGVVVLFTIFTY